MVQKIIIAAANNAWIQINKKAAAIRNGKLLKYITYHVYIPI